MRVPPSYYSFSMERELENHRRRAFLVLSSPFGSVDCSIWPCYQAMRLGRILCRSLHYLSLKSHLGWNLIQELFRWYRLDIQSSTGASSRFLSIWVQDSFPQAARPSSLASSFQLSCRAHALSLLFFKVGAWLPPCHSWETTWQLIFLGLWPLSLKVGAS